MKPGLGRSGEALNLAVRGDTTPYEREKTDPGPFTERTRNPMREKTDPGPFTERTGNPMREKTDLGPFTWRTGNPMREKRLRTFYREDRKPNGKEKTPDLLQRGQETL